MPEKGIQRMHKLNNNMRVWNRFMKVVAEASKSNYIKKVYVTTDKTIFNRLAT